MRTLRAWSLLVVACMISLPFVGTMASADGMAHVYPPTGESLLLSENAQLGIISYHDGDEMLAISVSVAQSDLMAGSKAAWIFPVPASPADVDITLVSSLHPFAATYSGGELSRVAGRELSTGQVSVMMSQVYTIPLSLALLSRDVSPALLLTPDHEPKSDGSEVLITETVESEGVVAELVGATDGSAIEEYLSSKGVSISVSEQTLIDEYIGEDYCFVVSWIEDTQYFIESAGGTLSDGEIYYNLGIGMVFPTERLYYPMKLTSAYGDMHVPMLVEVFGYCSPDDPRDYDIDIEYRTQGMTALPDGLESFSFDQYPGGEFPYYEYTRIWVDVESSSLTEDIWMDPDPPVGVSALAYTVENTLAVALLFSAIASLASAVLMAFVVFRPFRPRLERFALLSLLNFLSLVAVWLVLRSEKGRRFLVRPQTEPEPQAPERSYSDFLVSYSVTYVVLIVMLPMVFVALAA